jgi:hypothetical protein
VDVAAAADQVDDNEEDQKEEETENDGLTDEADSVYQEGEVIDMESEEEAVEELNGDDDEEEEDIPIEVLIFNHTSTYSSGKLPSLMVTVDHLDETTIYEKETKEEEEVEEEDVVEDGAFFFY